MLLLHFEDDLLERGHQLLQLMLDFLELVETLILLKKYQWKSYFYTG